MNYHHRELSVKYNLECTLESAIGLTDAERELIIFGTSPFNADRSDRWPAMVKRQRAKALNNFKNANAQARKGSTAAADRAARWADALANISAEAKQLHAKGEALAARLQMLASVWATARRANLRQLQPLPLDRLARLLWSTDALERAVKCQRHEVYRERHRTGRVRHLWSKRYAGSDVRKINTLAPSRKPWEAAERQASNDELLDECVKNLNETQATSLVGAWREFEQEHPNWDDGADGSALYQDAHVALWRKAARGDLITRLTIRQRYNVLQALAARMARAWKLYLRHMRRRVRVAGRRLKCEPKPSKPRRIEIRDVDADDPREKAAREQKWKKHTKGLRYLDALHSRARTMTRAEFDAERKARQEQRCTAVEIERTQYKSRVRVEQLFEVTECVGALQYFNRNRSKGTT
ncbi:MAG: hypothetical protein F9K29_03675 [Hyphomicrobiaceae bacterium]|nr:MAG: hypothetical protein F9K29_03675 [Hyphomicrobiaceae bacterium]